MSLSDKRSPDVPRAEITPSYPGRWRLPVLAARSGGVVTKQAGNTGLLTDGSSSGECWPAGSHSWTYGRQSGGCTGWVLAPPPQAGCLNLVHCEQEHT